MPGVLLYHNISSSLECVRVSGHAPVFSRADAINVFDDTRSSAFSQRNLGKVDTVMRSPNRGVSTENSVAGGSVERRVADELGDDEAGLLVSFALMMRDSSSLAELVVCDTRCLRQ